MIRKIQGPTDLPDWDFNKCRCENNGGEDCQYCAELWAAYEEECESQAEDHALHASYKDSQ
jgi:hypothetical protein